MKQLAWSRIIVVHWGGSGRRNASCANSAVERAGQRPADIVRKHPHCWASMDTDRIARKFEIFDDFYHWDRVLGIKSKLSFLIWISWPPWKYCWRLYRRTSMIDLKGDTCDSLTSLCCCSLLCRMRSSDSNDFWFCNFRSCSSFWRKTRCPMVVKTLIDSSKCLPAKTNASGVHDGACSCEVGSSQRLRLPRDISWFVYVFQGLLRLQTTTVTSEEEWMGGQLSSLLSLSSRRVPQPCLDELWNRSYESWRCQCASDEYIHRKEKVCLFLNIAVEDVFQHSLQC